MENNNKKEVYIKFNKKVVSISFLALALFMLLAVSYAYFTATVTGNDTAKKTTVTTGSMSLKLTGPTEIEPTNMVPGDSVSITFKVENTGNIAAIYSLDMIEVSNNFNPKSDLVYSIKSDKGANKENTVAPSSNGTLVPNIYIGTGNDKIHNYTLTITFLETHSNQNSNQGKTFSGKVQINSVEGDTLAAEILKNNPLQDSSTVNFSHNSPYCVDGPGCYQFADNGKGLFAASDDDGISYYFRGDVTNNNVIFAGKKWQIIRINGDGTIRLVYNDANAPTSDSFGSGSSEFSYAGYTKNNTHNCTIVEPCYSDFRDGTFKKYYINSNTGSGETTFTADDSSAKTALEAWYSTNLNGKDSQIALETFCNDTSGTRVDADRYNFSGYKSNLTCSDPINHTENTLNNYGGVYKLKIGLITASEYVLSGAGLEYFSPSNYLNINGWTMTPAMAYTDIGITVYVYNISSNYLETMGYSNDVVPVINLKSDVEFKTTGTGEPGSTTNPYTID